MEINWENISQKITDAADYTIKKTEQLSSIAKLEYKIANAKNKVNLRYQNMGKIKFAEMTGEEIAKDAYEKEYEKITGLLVTIDEMEDQLAQVRNYRHCIACNTKIANDVVFCPKCGTRQQPLCDEDDKE